MAAKKSTWVAGAAVVAVGAMVGSWFVGVGPTLASAADVQAQTEATRQQNQILRAKLETLKADFAKLPEYRADLAELQTAIPVDLDLGPYLDQLDAFATAHGVTVTEVTPQAPQLIGSSTGSASLPEAPAAATDGSAATPSSTPTAAPSEGTSGGAATTDDSARTDAAATGDAGASSVPPAIAGLVAVPISFTVLGPFPGAIGFLHDVQESSSRLMLVSGITGLGQGDQEAAAGKPATVRGDIELAITGFLYVLPEEPAETPTDDGSGATLPEGDLSTDPVAPNG
jgi:type II secretory pathway pseudopilin PulG